MKLSSTSHLSLGALLAVATASLLPAQVVNPGFEQATFYGWDISAGARASVVTTATDYAVDPFTLDFDLTQPYTVNPVGGNYFARLEAGSTSLAGTETFLGLAAGTIATPMTDPFGLADAAAVGQTVWLQAGTRFLFNWNFFATDLGGQDVGDDFAFFSATSAFGSVFTTLATVNGTGSGTGTGWQQVAFTAQHTGSYRLGFGVANYGDNTINSVLYIDPLPVGAVPEPSTYGLLGALALVGVVAFRRQRRA
jgi:hypothetical protein